MTPYFYFFFFNDTATTEIYTLSLHDALPICQKKGLSRFTKTQALGHQDSKASAASAQGVDIIKAIIAVSLRDAIKARRAKVTAGSTTWDDSASERARERRG